MTFCIDMADFLACERRKSSPLLAENIYLSFQFWTAAQVLQSSPQCELRERCVCVSRFSFISKGYNILIQAVYFLR
jgi:hypothetical protein